MEGQICGNFGVRDPFKELLHSAIDDRLLLVGYFRTEKGILVTTGF